MCKVAHGFHKSMYNITNPNHKTKDPIPKNPASLPDSCNTVIDVSSKGASKNEYKNLSG